MVGCLLIFLIRLFVAVVLESTGCRYPGLSDPGSSPTGVQLDGHAQRTHTFHVLDDPSRQNAPIVYLIDQNINGLGGQSLRSEYHSPNGASSSLIGPPLLNTKRFLTGGIHNSSSRVAQAYTNYLQQNGDNEVSAKVYTAVPFVDVHWLWLIYPIAIVIVCLVNLIITIYQTRKYGFPKWSTSLYPLLFAYGVNDVRNATTTASTAATEERDASLRGKTVKEPEDESRPVEPSKPLLTRPKTVSNNDLISALEVVAKESVVQLIKSDGQMVFEKPESR